VLALTATAKMAALITSVALDSASSVISFANGDTVDGVISAVFAAVGAGAAIKSIVKSGNTAYKAIAVAYSDDVAEAISKYGDDFVEMAKHYSDDVVKQADELLKSQVRNSQKAAIDMVESSADGSKVLTNIQKGNYGEMKMDAYFESQGYTRISTDRVTDLNAVTHQGIDGVYYKPDGQPPYIIGEAKYGSSTLSTLSDGTKQMSDDWIMNGKFQSSRLQQSVGNTKYKDILLNGYDRILTKIDSNGNISTYMLDESGKILK